MIDGVTTTADTDDLDPALCGTLSTSSNISFSFFTLIIATATAGFQKLPWNQRFNLSSTGVLPPPRHAIPLKTGPSDCCGQPTSAGQPGWNRMDYARDRSVLDAVRYAQAHRHVKDLFGQFDGTFHLRGTAGEDDPCLES